MILITITDRPPIIILHFAILDQNQRKQKQNKTRNESTTTTNCSAQIIARMIIKHKQCIKINGRHRNFKYECSYLNIYVYKYICYIHYRSKVSLKYIIFIHISGLFLLNLHFFGDDSRWI